MTIAAPDRAPDWVAEGTPEPLRTDLARLVGESAVLGRATDLVRYASDASPYRLIPQVVVQPRDPAGVARVIAYGREHGIPVTFRAGGTSLNGQGQGSGILVDVRRHWRGIEVLDEEASRVKVRPGTVLGHANRVLSRNHRKLGPDPASTDIATVGGVVANNSGGMRCGTRFDSYRTVCDMTFMTASGTVIDTSDPGAGALFQAEEPELAAGLAELRDEIRADEALAERIRHKYEIKNTTGYRLCAFLDADEPVEIFRRLIVGSEGTLALICDATFETLPVPAHTTTAWLHFAGIPEACAPVPDLVALGASAVELMVAPALMVAAMNIPGAPQDWLELPPESAVLLVEFGADEEASLDEKESAAIAAVGEDSLIRPADFTREREKIGVNWRVREGLHGLVGRLRVPGTALIVEDVCVPPARIAEAAKDIQALLGEHGYLTGVAGHTSAGNLHFMLTPDFAKQEDLDSYEAFMEGLVGLICDKYDGSLKAEHGTGVNMAPYVVREWGEQATGLMWRVKRLADPDGVLGPGVLMNDDPAVHLQNLKTTPEVEEVVNHCVECGFCEPACPSQDLTTTPRQRIVLRREMARQPAGVAGREGPGSGIRVRRARDVRSRRIVRPGLPALDRHRQAGQGAPGEGAFKARRGGCAPGRSELGRGRTRVARRPQARPARRAGRWGRPAEARAAAARIDLTRGRGGRLLPVLHEPHDGRVEEGEARPQPCRRHGRGLRAGGHAGLDPSRRRRVAAAASPGRSKGHRDGHAWMARQTFEKLWAWSGEGSLPIVSDASSCTLGLTAETAAALPEELQARHAELEILDSVEWLERLLPNLGLTRKLGRVAIHPTCATRHLGLAARLSAVAAEMADEVAVPAAARCCGFAGDRGMLHPELTASATAPQAAELRERGPFDAYLSTNRTCEIGMERATGEPYGSIILALEELTR